MVGAIKKQTSYVLHLDIFDAGDDLGRIIEGMVLFTSNSNFS